MFRCLYVIFREFIILYAKVTKLIKWKYFKNCKQPDLSWDLTFRGPCIVIYSYNKTNEMH